MSLALDVNNPRLMNNQSIDHGLLSEELKKLASTLVE